MFNILLLQVNMRQPIEIVASRLVSTTLVLTRDGFGYHVNG